MTGFVIVVRHMSVTGFDFSVFQLVRHPVQAKRDTGPIEHFQLALCIPNRLNRPRLLALAKLKLRFGAARSPG
jgi:hypothetical protein